MVLGVWVFWGRDDCLFWVMVGVRFWLLKYKMEVIFMIIVIVVVDE